MNTYKINRKYIKNSESYVLAILGCIYSEIKEIKKNGADLEYIEKLVGAIDLVTRNYRELVRLQHNPLSVLDRFDMLEVLENTSGGLVKFQENIDALVGLLKGPIEIEVIGGFPSYHDVLPDFRGIIKFKAV